MSDRSHLYLIGYRGSGKTTVARHLASRLRRSWIDTDVEIESDAGMTIREIFEREGESGFRDRESQTIDTVSRKGPMVIALGGGAILRESNRKVIRASGLAVWLEASPEELHRRIAGDATTAERRPALTKLAGYEEIKELLEARSPIYREVADFVVSTDGLSSENIADAIVVWWNARTA